MGRELKPDVAFAMIKPIVISHGKGLIDFPTLLFETAPSAVSCFGLAFICAISFGIVPHAIAFD